MHPLKRFQRVGSKNCTGEPWGIVASSSFCSLPANACLSQPSTQADCLNLPSLLASYFQTQIREHLTLTILLAVAELVRLFTCYLVHS